MAAWVSATLTGLVPSPLASVQLNGGLIGTTRPFLNVFFTVAAAWSHPSYGPPFDPPEW